VRRDPTTKKRRQLLRIVERSLVPERPFMGRGPRYIVRPTVTLACGPSLRAIASALSNETQHIDEASLDALRTFLTNGDSPFFGYEPTDALRESVRLQQLISPTALPTRIELADAAA
jgi:hypothetical protein